ncbi:Zinc finger DNA binding protein, partial [Operophtera brumata]
MYVTFLLHAFITPSTWNVPCEHAAKCPEGCPDSKRQLKANKPKSPKQIVSKELELPESIVSPTQNTSVSLHLKSIDDKFNCFQETISFINTQFEEMKVKLMEKKSAFDELEKKNPALETTVIDLSSRLSLAEQHMRESNVEINGLPEHRAENLSKTVLQLAPTVKVDIFDDHILHVTRVAKINKDSSAPRSVIVKLHSPRVRDTLLAAVSNFNKDNIKDKLSSEHMGIRGPRVPVFVSEHLTPSNKFLHAAARNKAKDLAYKFVWVRNGRIYVRKDETSQAYLSIDDKFNCFQETISFINTQFEEMKVKLMEKNSAVDELEKKNAALETTVPDLSSRLSLAEQHMRESNVEINGLPEKACVKVDISDDHMLHVTRVAKINKDSSAPRSVIVKLHSPRVRDTLLAAVSNFIKDNIKDKLSSEHMGIGVPRVPVFVSEHLTPSNKFLHAAARKKAKDLAYKFVWVRNGRIYVRKDETSQAYLSSRISNWETGLEDMWVTIDITVNKNSTDVLNHFDDAIIIGDFNMRFIKWSKVDSTSQLTPSNYNCGLGYSLIDFISVNALEKDKLRDKFKKYKNPRDKLEFDILRHRCDTYLDQCYKDFKLKAEENIAKDPKLFWTFIKSKRTNYSAIPSVMHSPISTATDGPEIANLAEASGIRMNIFLFSNRRKDLA